MRQKLWEELYGLKNLESDYVSYLFREDHLKFWQLRYFKWTQGAVNELVSLMK